MKKLCFMLAVLFTASAAASDEKNHRSSTTVRWQNIVGVITAQGVSNPVSSKIDSGTFAWSTSHGAASVDLANGATSFYVDGLVINGTSFTGTPGPVSAVVGTLVCNPGDPNQEVAVDTPAVPLDAQGDASFSSPIRGIPALCLNPLFLVRIAVPTGAAGRWIATGTERRMGSALQQ